MSEIKMTEKQTEIYINVLEKINHEIGKLMVCFDTLKTIDGVQAAADEVESTINGHVCFASDLEHAIKYKVIEPDSTLHESVTNW